MSDEREPLLPSNASPLELAAAEALAEIQRVPILLRDLWNPHTCPAKLRSSVKIEDRFCLPDADNIAAVPGISFAEWGPSDMGLSHGEPDSHDPPYSSVMEQAQEIVKRACDKSNLAFLAAWADPSMTTEQRARHLLFEVNARIILGTNQETADTLRKEMGRTMPW